jgi:hypothetical protein
MTPKIEKQRPSTSGRLFISPKKPRKGHPKPKKQKPDVVLGMIERAGRLRLVTVADEKMAVIEPVMKQRHQPRCIPANRQGHNIRHNR